MATYDEDSLTSSSDEEINEGLMGYQFEPKRSDVDQSSESSSDGDSSDSGDEPDHVDRLGNVLWCQCGRCSRIWLNREVECLCCQERDYSRTRAVPSNLDNTTCITNNEDLQILCLNQAVLRNVLVAINNIRGDHWGVNPPNNRGLRYAAYRQYSWWVHGRLGARRRRVIPACVTHVIRESFPKEADEEYEGFHSGENDSD